MSTKVVFFALLFAVNRGISDLMDESPATNEPQFVSKGGSLQAKEGEEISLECGVHDLGEFVILWKFNKTQVLFAGNLRIHRDDRISRDDTSGSLIIKDFRAENAGEYSCQISTNPPQDIVYHVMLIGPPIIKPEPENGDVTIQMNSSIRLKCDTNTEQITWKRVDTGRQLNGTTELLVENAQRADAGQYECTATNAIGQSVFAFRVRLLYPPEVHVQNSPVQHAPIGQSIEIACTVYAEPSSNVIWFNRNAKILPNDNFRFGRHNQTSTLKIINVTKDVYDNYTCVANNTLGSSHKTIEVTGRPSRADFTSSVLSSDETSYRLEWTIDSQSEITSYELRIRQINAVSDSASSDWKHLKISPNDMTSGVGIKQFYEIQNLVKDGNYELDLLAQNQFGSTRSDVFSFVTSFAEVLIRTNWSVLALSACLLAIAVVKA